MIVLTALGLVVASTSPTIHYAGIKPLCGTNGGGCEIVADVDTTPSCGIPVALIGADRLHTISGSLLLPRARRRCLHGRLHVIGFGFSARSQTR